MFVIVVLSPSQRRGGGQSGVEAKSEVLPPGPLAPRLPSLVSRSPALPVWSPTPWPSTNPIPLPNPTSFSTEAKPSRVLLPLPNPLLSLHRPNHYTDRLSSPLFNTTLLCSILPGPGREKEESPIQGGGVGYAAPSPGSHGSLGSVEPSGTHLSPAASLARVERL